jgi:subtilisin family serine protease
MSRIPTFSNPCVAFIDTGINPHRLASARIVAGVNFSGDGTENDTTDRHGHGTLVAATIAQHAPRARILPIKLMGDRGYLMHPAGLEQAFDWVMANWESSGIAVVCAAFADASHLASDAPFRGSALQTRIAELRERGVVTVAPAGNWYRVNRHGGTQGMAWPAILREVVSVGALRREAGRLLLTDNTQRLEARPGIDCCTTVFALPGPPGGTSGTAAVVAGHLATLRTDGPAERVDGLISRLLGAAIAICDENGCAWLALDLAA